MTDRHASDAGTSSGYRSISAEWVSRCIDQEGSAAGRQHLVDRTRYLFSTPTLPTIVVGYLAVAAVAGAVGFGIPWGIAIGVLLLGVPAVGATVCTPLIDHQLGGTVTIERSAFLSLACTLVVAVFVVGAAMIVFAGGGTAIVVDAILLATAGVFALRLLVIVAVSGVSLVSAAIPAAIQSMIGIAVVALMYSSLVTPATIVVVVTCGALYTCVVLGLFVLVEYPFRRGWGISAFEFVHLFLEWVAGQPTDLEPYFTRLGTTVRIPVTVLSMRRPSGEEKARVVSPLAHPGPLSGIGGGTLPYRLAEDSDGVFTPHGMAGHDYNPTAQRGVTAVCDAATRALDEITYDRTATQPIRRVAGDATVIGQAFGDGALMISTFAPRPTDDIHHDVGRVTATSAHATGIENPLLVDAHNCQPMDNDTVDDGRTEPGSDRAQELVRAVERMGTDLLASDREPLRVGVASDSTPWDTTDGIGPLGVRVLATETGRTTAVYVLVDGNNMVAGLRESIRDALEHDFVEVLTTDTHEVNHLSATNYVGCGIDTEAFVALVERVSADAIADLEPVEAGTATETAEITVFGAGTIAEIAAFTDRILPLCGVFVLLSTLLVTAVGVVLFWLV